MTYCAQCGTAITGEGNFCPNCGANLRQHQETAAASAAAVPPETAPGDVQAPERQKGWVGISVLALITIIVVALAVGAFLAKRQQAAVAAALARATARQSLLVEVPDLRGLTALQATDQVKKADLVVGKLDYDAEATGAAGAVVAQNPSPGIRIAKKSIVVLTVAGPQPISVPKLLGLDRSGAQAAAAAVGLNIIAVDANSAAKAGSIISQQPAPGSSIAPGSSVNVWVAKGVNSSSADGANSDGTHTPPKGSAERTAIMDACRIYFSYSGKFLVNELKVKGSRAFANVTPQDYPGYGAVGVYLLKNGSGWVVSTDSRMAAARGSFVSEDEWMNNR